MGKKQEEKLNNMAKDIASYKSQDVNFKLGVDYFGRMILSSLQKEKEYLREKHSKSRGFETIEISSQLQELNNIIEYINEELELELGVKKAE